jgi:hypothetical protein
LKLSAFSHQLSASVLKVCPARRRRKTRPSPRSKRPWGLSTYTAARARFPSKAPRTAVGNSGVRSQKRGPQNPEVRASRFFPLTRSWKHRSLCWLTHGKRRQRVREGGSKTARGGGKWQGNTKKILNRGNEPNKSFRINNSRKKRTQNEPNFECKNAQITPKKWVLGGTFHVTGGSSADSRFPESLRPVAARPPHPTPSADGLKKAPARATPPQGGGLRTGKITVFRTNNQ